MRSIVRVPLTFYVMALELSRQSRWAHAFAVAPAALAEPVQRVSAPPPPTCSSVGAARLVAGAPLFHNPWRLRGPSTPLRALSSAGQTLQRPPARGPTLHVYVFVTIVGWGKNTLLDTMLPELRGLEPCPTWHLGAAADATDGQNLPSLFEGPDMQQPTILESDTIGAKQFWPAVQESVLRTDDETVHHLFLNKNFPPNAWSGARKKLGEYCKSTNRPLILYAIVPNRYLLPIKANAKVICKYIQRHDICKVRTSKSIIHADLS